MSEQAAKLPLPVPGTSEQVDPGAVDCLVQDEPDKQGDKVSKKKGRGQDVSQTVVSALSSKIDELEKSISSSNQLERDTAKLRRKQLREVQKYVSDRSLSVEERMTFLQNKYTQQTTDLLRTEKQYYDVVKELDGVNKEKDRVQTELKKANTLKDKLEELCRQLQREVKEVAEESRRRNEEELKQRQALQQRFTQAINDVSAKMDQHQQERVKQIAENDALRDRLNHFLEQFELQEKQYAQQLQAKDLELQLVAVKLEQQVQINAQLSQKSSLLEQTNEHLTKAHETVAKELDTVVGMREQNVLLTESNKELKSQLEHYYEKFAEFQTTLTKSNQMFDKLKKELETHHSLRNQLQKERDELKKKCDKSDVTVIQLLDEKTTLKKQVEKLQSKLHGSPDSEELKKLRMQKERLEGLCRALQAQLKCAKTSEGDAIAKQSPELSESTGPAADASQGSTDQESQRIAECEIHLPETLD